MTAYLVYLKSQELLQSRLASAEPGSHQENMLSPLAYACLIRACAQFSDQHTLASIVFETTVLGVELDLNTWITLFLISSDGFPKTDKDNGIAWTSSSSAETV